MDITSLRSKFPLLATMQDGQPLVYLDSAATAQKLQSVIDAEKHFYEAGNANIHRGVYRLSQDATTAYEHVRTQVADFMHAASSDEIVFTRSATESLNLLANTVALAPGDIVLVSGMEHHANLVPWYMACQRTGAELQPIPLTDAGEIDMEAYARLLSPRVRIVACAHVSNVLGTSNDVKTITAMAHKAGALAIIDGSQAVMHMPVDMQELDVDAYVWTGHKLFGPTGTGILYAKKALLDSLPPWQGGGDMIESVSFDKITYREAPARFEAGTPNIAGVIGLGAAIDFMQALDWPALQAHEADITQYALAQLAMVPGLRLIGTADHRAPVFSFVLDGIHAHDVGSVLDSRNVCVRTGQHCAEPVMQRFGISATTRISCALYNTREEIDATISALHHAISLFR